MPQKHYHEFFRFRITGRIGSGQFSNVDKGTWKDVNGVLQVAVKTLNSGASELDKVRFLQEAAIMGQFKHPNVLRLYGVVTEGSSVSGLTQQYIFLRYPDIIMHALSIYLSFPPLTTG